MRNRRFTDRIVSLLSYLEKQINYTEHLNQIKTSGYFSLLYINSKAMYTKNITNIFILPNDILKRIYIHDKKKKLIPHTFLTKLFRKQIGYPKNFASLNSALSKIIQWYSDRGYQWSLVEIKQAADPSCLIVSINEGLVNTITVEYYTLSFEKLLSISSTESIEHYLGVKVGLPLNIDFLQKRINYLKDNQLVGDIIYSIERSTNTPMNLDIKFQIQELRDKNLLVLAENLSKTYQIISYAYNLLGSQHSFPNWLLASKIMPLSTSKLQACYFNCKINSKNIYRNTSHLIKLLTSSISRQKTAISEAFNFQTLLSWTTKKTIGVQLCLRNLDRAKSFFLFNLKFIQGGLNIKIFYLNPSLIVHQDLSFQLAVQIIKQYYTDKKLVSPLFLTKGNLTQCIFESMFKYHLTPYFSISEKIILSRVNYTDFIFYNSETINRHKGNRNQVSSNYCILKPNKKLLHQDFLSLLLSLRYQNSSYLDWPLKAYLFEIKSLYFTPFQHSNFLNSLFFDNYKKLFFHKIYLKQISHFNLPLYFKNHLNHILISTIKCQSNLNMETVYLLLNDYPTEYSLFKSIFTFSIKVKMEYLVPISRNIRVSLFYNYLDCFLNRQSKQSAYILQNSRSKKQIPSFLLEKFLWGFGIQLKLPIKQMPPLSIEYTINRGCHFCIYLHIYYQR